MGPDAQHTVRPTVTEDAGGHPYVLTVGMSGGVPRGLLGVGRDVAFRSRGQYDSLEHHRRTHHLCWPSHLL